MIVLSGGSEQLLTEVAASDELQLQERLKTTPDLLPIDEWGLEGPLLVVGRETTLPSGAVDLIALAPSGDVLVVEMKTGPQNADFRGAIAQVTDYGADLWQMTYEVFESAVAARYFSGPHCLPAFKGATSLAAAAKTAWPDLTDEGLAAFRQRLTALLESGNFNYVVVAQRFTASMMTTARYHNDIAGGRARFYLVELVRFSGEGLGAFEARTIVRPESRSASVPTANEHDFLEAILDPTYREALERFFETCHGFELRFDWGSVGTSIRLPTPYRAEPVSIAWIFPPGTMGWLGLRDVTLGFDLSQASDAQGSQPVLETYSEKIAALAGASSVTKPQLKASNFSPSGFVAVFEQVIEVIAEAVELMNGAAPAD